MGLNPTHMFSGYLRIPGQVPGQTAPLSSRPVLDPEIAASLEQRPPVWSLDRMTETPMLTPQDTVRGLGLTKALEHTIALRVAKESATSPNQLVFQKALNATMQEMGLPNDLAAVINARASRFYKGRMKKSQVFSIAELAELKKATNTRPVPLLPLTPDRQRDLAEAKRKRREEMGSLEVLKASDRYLYPRLHMTGEKAREKKLRKEQGLEKAKFEQTGGAYHAKVKKDGKTKYYYDEKKYKAEHGEHITGEQAKQQHIHDSVLRTAEAAHVDGGCDITHFRDLVQKHGSKPVHAAVRQHVEDGTLEYKKGRFIPKKKPAKLQKSDRPLIVFVQKKG